MAKKPKVNLLESLLRYEIILALFTLIGVYYFLTFSPVRMPRETITSPTIELPSPPPVTAKKPDTAVSRTTEIKPAPPVSVDNQKNHKISEAKLPEPTPRLSEVKVMEKKTPTPPAKPPIKKKAAVVTPIEPKPTTIETSNKAAAGQKPAKPQKKSYVIQAGIFIFPETLKHYQHMLQDHGYASFVTTRKRLLPMHRVFLGPYPNLARARKTIRTINKWDDDPFPCRRGKQFYVNVGSFYYQTTAREKISQYRSRGFIPVDFHEPVKIPHHILLVDGFSFNHYPRSALRSIKQLGIPDAFVRNWQP
ncbi:MAG: SPOR domain-containing protein [Pseudomonadota bacterium]|nr:SPOR domain-containing protein [Pseudomonadota bacterium]